MSARIAKYLVPRHGANSVSVSSQASNLLKLNVSFLVKNCVIANVIVCVDNNSSSFRIKVFTIVELTDI